MQWTAEGSVISLCVIYLGNRWTDLRQIHTEDMFGFSSLKVKVKG